MAASTKRKSKVISKKEDIDFLTGLTRKDITSSMFMKLFGDFDGHGEPRFNPYDIITIPKGAYGKDINPNTNEFTTTVGKLIFNKIMIEEPQSILKCIGWADDIMTKKKFNALYNKIGYLRLENKVTLDDYIYFCNNTQAIMPFVSILANGFSDTMLTSSKEITKKKEQLLKANKAAIENNDIKVITDISDELVDYAKNVVLKDDPAMDMYNSGSLGDFGNNYKNMFIMKGACRNPDPAKPFDIITSNYIDGVSAEDYPKFANTMIEGPYNRGKKTEVGGWWEKLFVSAFQHIKLLEPGSDCGTTRYITMDIDEDSIDRIMYCYVLEGNKLVEITSENRDHFIGKKGAKIRFASLCEAKNGICSKCAGNLWYRLGFTNVGVMTPQIPSKYKLKAMKSFHDSQVKLTEMDPMRAFSINE